MSPGFRCAPHQVEAVDRAIAIEVTRQDGEVGRGSGAQGNPPGGLDARERQRQLVDIKRGEKEVASCVVGLYERLFMSKALPAVRVLVRAMSGAFTVTSSLKMTSIALMSETGNLD